MRLRLIIYFAIIVLVTISSMLFFATLGAANEVRSYMFRGGMYRTSGLMEELQDHYRTFGSWQGVEKLFASHGQVHGWGNPGTGQGMGGMMRQRLILADAEGNIVADTSNAFPSGILHSQELNQAFPIEMANTTVGYLVSEGGVAFSVDDEAFLVGRLTRAAFIAGILAGGLSLILALFLAYRLLRPVQELTQAAQSLGQGDLTQRSQIHGDDELAELGRTFNRMADSLEKAEKSRRAMTADIAHELRTPLAVQRAYLEALQDGVYPLSTDNLRPILEHNLLLTRLVEDLRTLALVDAGQLELECTNTDFPDLVKRVMESFEPQATAADIDLSLSIEPAQGRLPEVMIDAMRVEQVISNLISNAFRFTPSNGVIELKIRPVANGLVLTVHDSGEGLSPEALPHIFERFYRADRSRSRLEGGTGLGLAIARNLTEAHGGTLIAENHLTGGAIFSLTLPVIRK